MQAQGVHKAIGSGWFRSSLGTEPALTAQRYQMAPTPAARLVSEVLEAAGIPLDSLSSKGQLAAQLIASICGALALPRPALGSVLAAWAQLKLRESRAAVLQVGGRSVQLNLQRRHWRVASWALA